MTTYNRKVTSVEARQYEGPKLVVISDSKGEQIANSGDFLVGNEPGKVYVIAKADFLEDYDLPVVNPVAEPAPAPTEPQQ